MSYIGRLVLLLVLPFAGCGILDSNSEGERGEEVSDALEFDFQLDRVEETGFLSVSPQLRNIGEQALTILQPDPCTQDLLVHRSDEFESEVVWSRRETTGGCILKEFADIHLEPGIQVAVPLGVGIPLGNIPEEVISPGLHAVSYEWPVVLARAGQESVTILEARVGVIDASRSR